MLAPDSADPPELQFYKVSMFWVGSGASKRLMAHALLYAPAPYPELGSAYGMMQVSFKVRGARPRPYPFVRTNRSKNTARVRSPFAARAAAQAH